jgi:very-short-patch-repair endonuclease
VSERQSNRRCPQPEGQQQPSPDRPPGADLSRPTLDGDLVDPVVALEARLGASWWSQLRDAGVTDGDLRAAVRRGRVRAVGGGIYALADVDPDVLVAATLHGRLTCVSAAVRHGLDVLHRPARPHVAVPRNRPTTSAEAIVHRVDVPGDGPVVPLVASLLTLVRCLPALDAVVTLDSAVRQRAVRVTSLAKRTRGRGSVEVRRRLAMVDGRAGSVIETVLRLAMRQAGLQVACQVSIPGAGRVDFVVEGWLVVEVDGFQFHSTRDQYRTDRRRANAIAGTGYRLLRFTYEDVMFRLPETLAKIQAVLAAGR